MNNPVKLFNATIIATIIVASCNNNNSSTVEILLPEVEHAQESMEVSSEAALKAFHAHLKEIKEPHKLCTNCPGESTKVVIGDLNSDGLMDAIVQYTFEPNEDDMQFGQSAIYNCVGFVVLENRNNTLTVIQNIPIADVLEFSTTESVSIKEINPKGEIILEKIIDTDFEPEFSNETSERHIAKLYKTKLLNGKIKPIDTSNEKPIN